MQDGEEKGYLQNKDSRHAIDEIPVPCLMAEDMHADDAADASADNGNNEQSGFRNPPQIFLCLVFIQPHKEEANKID